MLLQLYLRKLEDTQGEMLQIYSTGKVCNLNTSTESHAMRRDGCQELEPDLVNIMANSRDYDILLQAWKGWRDAVGVAIGDLYPDYVKLVNLRARNKGYKDMASESLQTLYEIDDFDKLVEGLYDEIRPLYVELHTYVRRKLSSFYGSDKVGHDSLIPAHILGNMWAQQWTNIYDIVAPYPDKPSVDVTSQMISKGYTAMRMFEMADEFFQSLGFQPMPKSFWNKSVFVKPTDRDIVCHPSAEDFFTDKDVRIKMCTEVNMFDLYTIHHEMGHCQYYLSYRRQPIIFRAGANPAFHEAVGDTIALSVNTPKHLHSVGLLEADDRTYEEDINFLMRQALERVVLLPYALVIDKWRWTVYRGQISPQEYNSKWWQLRAQYQGLSPPIERSERDFDPGAKYHVAAGIPYIRYFVSFLIQFQFHKALCEEAGFQGPIHRCDIHSSKNAGQKLRHMMEIGRSRPWPDVMQVITGQRNIQTEAILEYFQPLMDWLKSQNDGNNHDNKD
ncbi:angiotensin-converting enzyme-like isoform X2 [Ptychodera flava]|uniref:angiotensin-converting enzyme-like isoform X2 n=1 Tax=Ptychodera flava TaxID=63121 RepID=UPI00396A35FF